MTATKGMPLKRGSMEVKVEIYKCIICQKKINREPIGQISERKRLLDAADSRNDTVSKRLRTVDHEMFVYHMNNDYYKNYIR